MIVVADTSPINYLLLIGQIDLLPRLFGEIIIPDAVRDELLDPGASPALHRWIAQPPPWLVVQTVSVTDAALKALDPGEQAAITLAQTWPADLLIIDERRGRQAASDRGLSIIGTLGILDDAASQGWIDIAAAIARLQQTNFRISRQMIERLLQKPVDM